MSIDLLKHNFDAYRAAILMLNSTGKAAIIHPTGTGKSFIGFKLAEEHQGALICWLTPSEYIYTTQLENLTATGSDVPKNIRFFTYAKLMLMSESELTELRPDYIILDEFHRCGAEMWGQGVQNLLDMYEEVPILGLSATNIRYLDNQRDMADELFDGNIASYMTLGEAIVRGILNPPIYVTALYSYQKVYEKYKRRIENVRNKAAREAGKKYLDVLRRTLERADGLDEIFHKHMQDVHGKYIIFCSNKEHMDEMMTHTSEWFSKVDESPRLYSVYSADPTASQSFLDFKNDKINDHLRLLFCIDSLNEGIHIEDISGVILFRPTVSPIIYKQQIGRTMSTSKKNATVILDIVDNIGNLYSISAIQDEMQAVINYYQYRHEGSNIVNGTFQVIDELHDCKQLFDELEGSLSASWDIMYNEATNYYQEHHDLLVKRDYVTTNGYNLGIWIGTQRGIRAGSVIGSLSYEQIKKLDNIGMCWLTRNERIWEENYNVARDFYIRNGHLHVPSDVPKLKTWLIRQRQRYRDNRITEEQYNRLSAIDMIWGYGDSWEDYFTEASAYYSQYGNLDIPANYITKSGVKLGLWYRRMRNLYSNGRLSVERQNRLESIGIEWTSIKVRTWMRYYKAAVAFYVEHRHLCIDSTYKTPDGLNLGVWLSSQRYSYSLGRLQNDQIRRLEEIEMDWHRLESKWDNGFKHCEAFFLKNGNLDVAADYVSPDGFKLGTWLVNQRTKYKSGKLVQEQINRLSTLNMYWGIADSNWQRNFEALRLYAAEHGNFVISHGYSEPNDLQLYYWVANQRTKRKNGKLTDQQIEQLDSIRFPWAPNQDRWEAGYEHAKKFYDEHGNLRVPQNYITMDGFSLGTWIASQRKRYQKGKIELWQVELLSQIGFRNS